MTNGKPRILLVEDHGDTLKLYEQLLGLEGYAVRSADSLAAALSLAQTESFDLLICDIGLPDGSGAPLLERLRQRMPQLAGIVVSGYSHPMDIADSLRAGYSIHLSKPIHPQQLLEAIDRAIEPSQRASLPRRSAAPCTDQANCIEGSATSDSISRRSH